MGLEWIRGEVEYSKGSGDDSSQSVRKVDINGKKISKQKRPNSPPCHLSHLWPGGMGCQHSPSPIGPSQCYH